ncbi:helix-turn-helix domain-containing protein, partial [Azospirillum brasilense]|nr:helix-turn-helix domain-containing protein [Azospirillum brasilense]
MADQKLKDVIVVATPTEGIGPTSSLPTRPATPSEEPDRQRMAERLRAQGWSYRRIAEELQVSYILVSRWLGGDGATPTGPR